MRARRGRAGVCIVVGTRPEIVKMAPVVRECQRRRVPFALVHTGQHYSYAMDGVFFDELDLPRPDVNLEVGSASHASQVATIVSRLEPVLRDRRPRVVLVEGDTNSVLAGALTARGLGIRLGHVEAGLRSYDRRMPEESNRVVVDHLSDDLYAPTRGAQGILVSEGIDKSKVHVTGNTVVDELERQRPRAERLRPWAKLGVKPRGYAVATVHRPENTDSDVNLRGIVEGLRRVAKGLKVPVVLPLHPRTRRRLEALGLDPGPGIHWTEPLGYLEFVGLCAAAALILTDSGGLQEEACALRVPCVTLRDSTERPESVSAGANVLAGASASRIAALSTKMIVKPRRWRNPFGDGRAARRVIAHCLKTLGSPRPGR
jgi:UDP-N-acetylglucosamine 2-epimerase (non-hydrolysing)